jgi:2-dehydropantoate 2-reductase
VSNAAEKPIVVAGAGSIGCFVGGLLAAAGRNVTLLARRRVIEEIHANGLHLTSLEGGDWRVAAPAIGLMEAPAAMAGAKIVLVTVKSLDTAAMADLIAAHAPADAVIVSLQNGVDNVPLLRERLPGRRVLAGMVPFNVVSMGGGHVHRATSGDIVLERDDADTAAQLSVPGLAIIPSDRMTDVQWGKLLFNLNNAINALSNLPLREQLSQRPWRRILAAQMAEALAAMKAAGIVRAPPAGRHFSCGCGADAAYRSASALFHVGGSAAGAPNRGRPSARGDHSPGLSTWLASAAVGAHRCAREGR